MDKIFRDIYFIVIISIPITFAIVVFESLLKEKVVYEESVEKVFYEKIKSDVPETAVYNGYEMDLFENKTILYYVYKNRVHTVHIYHPINRFTQTVDWFKTIHIEYF